MVLNNPSRDTSVLLSALETREPAPSARVLPFQGWAPPQRSPWIRACFYQSCPCHPIPSLPPISARPPSARRRSSPSPSDLLCASAVATTVSLCVERWRWRWRWRRRRWAQRGAMRSMLVSGVEGRSRTPHAYLTYLAAARRAAAAEPGLRPGCGRAAAATAGFGGRIGPHAVPLDAGFTSGPRTERHTRTVRQLRNSRERHTPESGAEARRGMMQGRAVEAVEAASRVSAPSELSGVSGVSGRYRG